MSLADQYSNGAKSEDAFQHYHRAGIYFKVLQSKLQPDDERNEGVTGNSTIVVVHSVILIVL
jgi:hypothetical protein